jgi:pectate lyase
MQKEDQPGAQTWIVGGGAYKASDKIIQHNGCGKVNVSRLLCHFFPQIHKLTLGLDHQLLR